MPTLWGYSISAARSIDYDKNDPLFRRWLAIASPSSQLCIGCGGCTAACSAGNLTEFNIRRLQMLVKRGESRETAEQLHKCMLCGKCLLVCPRGVDTRQMILSMKRFLREHDQ